MFSQYLEGYDVEDLPIDVDLGLIEARDDVHAPWSRRVLAGLSVGIPADDAHDAAAELCCAVDWLAAGRPEGTAKLIEILNAPGDDYQRALWFSVVGRDVFGVIADIGWLEQLLGRRREIAQLAEQLGGGYRMAQNPYLADSQIGPRGVFGGEFETKYLSLAEI